MAKQMIDYLSGEDGDLLITDGDWTRGENTHGHQRNLLENGKNDYKANPTICVDIDSYIDETDKTAVVRAIAREFMKDGMEVENLVPNVASVSDSTVNVFDGSFYK